MNDAIPGLIVLLLGLAIGLAWLLLPFLLLSKLGEQLKVLKEIQKEAKITNGWLARNDAWKEREEAVNE